MRRSILLGLVVACGLVARAGKPKPPLERQLNGDDAKRAAEWERKIGALEEAGKLAEAVRPARELVALRTRRLGADHWETTSAHWRAETLAKLA